MFLKILFGQCPIKKCQNIKFGMKLGQKSIAGTGYVVEDSKDVIQKLYWVPFGLKIIFLEDLLII